MSDCWCVILEKKINLVGSVWEYKSHLAEDGNDFATCVIFGNDRLKTDDDFGYWSGYYLPEDISAKSRGIEKKYKGLQVIVNLEEFQLGLANYRPNGRGLKILEDMANKAYEIGNQSMETRFLLMVDGV